MYLSHFQTAGWIFTILLLQACLVSANINIMNWCTYDIYAYQVVGGDCNRGADYQCYAFPGHVDPYVIKSGSNMIFSLLYQPGAKIYLLKGNQDLEHGKFQFEYTITPTQFFYDLSNVDGAGPGQPGNYFDEENVTITPTGDLGKNFNCNQVNCPPASSTTQCMDAYWHPNDDAAAMRTCPPDTGDFLLDICGNVRPFPVAARRTRDRFRW
ncbi:hypothetical protein V8E51_003748 [Hyaloscypha variabilis]